MHPQACRINFNGLFYGFEKPLRKVTLSVAGSNTSAAGDGYFYVSVQGVSKYNRFDHQLGLLAVDPKDPDRVRLDVLYANDGITKLEFFPPPGIGFQLKYPLYPKEQYLFRLLSSDGLTFFLQHSSGKFLGFKPGTEPMWIISPPPKRNPLERYSMPGDPFRRVCSRQ